MTLPWVQSTFPEHERDDSAAFIIPVYKDKYVRSPGGWLTRMPDHVKFHAPLPNAICTFAPLFQPKMRIAFIKRAHDVEILSYKLRS